MSIIIKGGTLVKGSTIIRSATPAPTSVLIGYVQASPTPSFINDCTTTFTNVLCTVPIYMAPYGELGNTTVYSLGQLPTDSAFSEAGVPFYTDTALTTKLPPQGGRVYGFNTNFNGVPNRQIRIANTTPPVYNGHSICTISPYGYYVQSTTKVNVGNTNRMYTASDDSLIPYVGQRLYSSSGFSGFTSGQTYAWAAEPNVTATHLITFASTTRPGSVS